MKFNFDCYGIKQIYYIFPWSILLYATGMRSKTVQ